LLKGPEASIGTHDDIEMIEDTDKKFKEYPCFYCNTMIKHREEIETHKVSCHEASLISVCPYNCDKCGERCKNEDEFNKHKTLNHAP
jgi:hypothetical protein